mgnify:CR=1 FL=1
MVRPHNHLLVEDRQKGPWTVNSCPISYIGSVSINLMILVEVGSYAGFITDFVVKVAIAHDFMLEEWNVPYGDRKHEVCVWSSTVSFERDQKREATRIGQKEKMFYSIAQQLPIPQK